MKLVLSFYHVSQAPSSGSPLVASALPHRAISPVPLKLFQNLKKVEPGVVEFKVILSYVVSLKTA